MRSGSSYKICQTENIVFETRGKGSFYKKSYIMLVGPNLPFIAFRVHCAIYWQLGERKGSSRDKGAH